MPIPGSRPPRSGGGQGGERRGYPRPNNRYQDDFNRGEPVARQQPFSPPPPVTPPEPVQQKPVPAVASSASAFTAEEIRELVQLIQENDITELLLERDNGAQRLVIKREHPVPAPVVVASVAAAPAIQAAPATALPASVAAPALTPQPAAAASESLVKVTAPMVGTFYRSADPKEAPFVSVGDTVEKDQVIGIIEAMKIMNEIRSEQRGRCVRVSVENGQPVEYGQTLLLLDDKS